MIQKSTIIENWSSLLNEVGTGSSVERGVLIDYLTENSIGPDSAGTADFLIDEAVDKGYVLGPNGGQFLWPKMASENESVSGEVDIVEI